MSTQRLPAVELDSSVVPQHVVLAEIEEIIHRIGARYLDDLRMLSTELRRVYEAQLTAKDEQIEELSQRLEAADRERSKLEAHIHELTRHLAHVHALSEELSQHLDTSQDDSTHEHPRMDQRHDQ